MINWDNFYVFAAVSICLWLIGAVFALRSSTRSKTAIGFTSGGIIVLAVFITGLWLFLQRPPLRTMGETRLWYSFFMGIAGLLTYIRWQYRWILSFSALLATVFVIINLMKPEIHDQSLMPALQSIWFIPHVTVYMFSYSVLGCAFIIALTGLFRHKEEYLHTADNLVRPILAAKTKTFMWKTFMSDTGILKRWQKRKCCIRLVMGSLIRHSAIRASIFPFVRISDARFRCR